MNGKDGHRFQDGNFIRRMGNVIGVVVKTSSHVFVI